MDPKPPEQDIFTGDFDVMHAFIYDPGTPFTNNPTLPGIPTTNRHVQLSLSSLDRFTQTLPAVKYKGPRWPTTHSSV